MSGYRWSEKRIYYLKELAARRGARQWPAQWFRGGPDYAGMLGAAGPMPAYDEVTEVGE